MRRTPQFTKFHHGRTPSFSSARLACSTRARSRERFRVSQLASVRLSAWESGRAGKAGKAGNSTFFVRNDFTMRTETLTRNGRPAFLDPLVELHDSLKSVGSTVPVELLFSSSRYWSLGVLESLHFLIFLFSAHGRSKVTSRALFASLPTMGS